MSTVLATEYAPVIAALGTLQLEHGGIIDTLEVAYEVHGDASLPAVLVLGGISSGRALLSTDARKGWWPGVAGQGSALDPAHYRLISIDFVGGRGASTPAFHNGARFTITTADQAAACAALLDELGIDVLHAIVGASYGGMVALSFAARLPERVERVVALCAAHRSHAHATAVRSVQRRILQLGLITGAVEPAVATARALAITTYRTATEFDERFDGPGSLETRNARFPVDSYLDHHGKQYAESFSVESFLTLSESLDLHRVDAAKIRARCSLVCFDSDTLVPPAEVHSLAQAIGVNAHVQTIRTRYGHDGFLKEVGPVNAAIGAALADRFAFQRTTAGAPPALGADGQSVTHYAGRRPEDAETRAWPTGAARAGIGADTQHGAVIPPIHLSTTYTFEALGVKRAYDYTRSGNPTRDTLAGAIAELEHGAAAIVTATGMGAINVTLQLLNPGDLLVAAHDGYGGTYRLLQALARKGAFELQLLNLTEPDAQDRIRALRPRMVWVETPSNPLLRITDVRAIADAARAVGALCVADNTFLSPALQTPLLLGADAVVHSTTKYLNGHSDVVGGAVVARDLALAEELGWWANCTGATGSPFDSYLTLRGLRTLHVRMRAHHENARAVITRLQRHEAVRAVYYPGLVTHRGHDIAVAQQRGFGAMVSFELHGGENEVRAFCGSLRHFSLAESLGGVESLIAHPATMTHAAMDPAGREAAGISDSLLRLSVGIEDSADLVGDIDRALDAAVQVTQRQTR